MKRVFISTLLLVFCSLIIVRIVRIFSIKSNNTHNNVKIDKKGDSFLKPLHRPYQDVIVNNRVIVKGHGPNCNSRYEAIKNILRKFKRPITVLDIGAAAGYMTFRVANDFESTCVMISDPAGESISLKKLCELNTYLDNIVLLNKRVSADELILMSKCEHFDVVLALNVVHHFPPHEWKKAAQAILQLGDFVIIETPPIEDTITKGQIFLRDIIDFIENHEHKVIAKTKRHTNPNLFANMYFVKGTKKRLDKRSWFGPTTPGYEIVSNLNDRFLMKLNDDNKGLKLPFPKGINLMTFKRLNGTFPTKQVIKDSLAKLLDQSNKLLLPQNIIIQGNSVELIDEITSVKNYDSAEIIKYVNGVIDSNELDSIFYICKLLSDKVLRVPEA